MPDSSYTRDHRYRYRRHLYMEYTSIMAKRSQESTSRSSAGKSTAGRSSSSRTADKTSTSQAPRTPKKKMQEAVTVPDDTETPIRDPSCEAMLAAATHISKKIDARKIFVFADGVDDLDEIRDLKLGKDDLMMILREGEQITGLDDLEYPVLTVPNVSLTRMGQIKMAVVLAFSQRKLEAGDMFVFLTGPMGETLDTLMVMKVGQEWEMFQSVAQPALTEHIRRMVFERVFSLALKLAHEGREGKPAGAIFVLGDTREVNKFCQQSIINPFKGYPENERNIMDHQMTETVKEFSAIDGAFVIKGNGVIVSAGTYLKGVVSPAEIPAGLGARHRAAAGVTAVTRSIAVTISESTGTVRVWRRGEMITEIERATRTGPPDMD